MDIFHRTNAFKKIIKKNLHLHGLNKGLENDALFDKHILH